MYIHIGNEKLVKSEDVIGIFDLDNTTVSKRTRDFLRKAEKNGEAETISYDLPKSFVVCKEANNGKQRVYISQLSVATLEKRSRYIETLQEE
ncbi:MAG: DUF370 domain-containing protein [Clostridia bacterium]|nr:DUF370 domain-containing protein [Clostridia bacterium]